MKLPQRLRVALHVLRGHAVMYRVGVVADTPRIFVGPIHDSHTMCIVKSKGFRAGTSAGEVYVFDTANEMVYPLDVYGEIPSE